MWLWIAIIWTCTLVSAFAVLVVLVDEDKVGWVVEGRGGQCTETHYKS
jgi:hypothetical protein